MKRTSANYEEKAMGAMQISIQNTARRPDLAQLAAQQAAVFAKLAQAAATLEAAGVQAA